MGQHNDFSKLVSEIPTVCMRGTCGIEIQYTASLNISQVSMQTDDYYSKVGHDLSIILTLEVKKQYTL